MTLIVNQVPHPTDCTKFYSCQKLGWGGETASSSSCHHHQWFIICHLGCEIDRLEYQHGNNRYHPVGRPTTSSSSSSSSWWWSRLESQLDGLSDDNGLRHSAQSLQLRRLPTKVSDKLYHTCKFMILMMIRCKADGKSLLVIIITLMIINKIFFNIDDDQVQGGGQLVVGRPRPAEHRCQESQAEPAWCSGGH